MFECGLETGSCLAPSEQRIQNRAKCAAKMGAGDESFLQFASCSSEAKVGQEQSTLRLYYERQLGGDLFPWGHQQHVYYLGRLTRNANRVSKFSWAKHDCCHQLP